MALIDHNRLAALLLAGASITACSGDGVDVPPQRPSATISGSAIDGVIVDGTVNVYAFANGVSGERLGGGVTDSDGRYTVNVRAPDGPVLIEVTGGRYVEEATGASVALQDGQRLRSIALYQSGQPLTVAVTPLTHLAAGLAEYRIAHGAAVDAAFAGAVADVSQAYGVQARDTEPRVITDARNVATELTDGHYYGFLLAGISSWTRAASEDNGVDPHTTYTSMALAQLMYQDIRADGALDGRGVGGDGQGMDLAVGTVALDADVYRISFAQHMMSMAASNANLTGLGADELRERAVALATTGGGVFGGEPPDPDAAQPPEIRNIEPEGLYYSGVFTYEVIVRGAAVNVTFDIDGVEIGAAQDLSRPSITIDSRAYADGEHRLGVTADDGLGNETRRDFAIHIDNTRPFINVTSPQVTSNPDYLLRGTAEDNGAGIASITVNGVAASIAPDDSWVVAARLSTGINVLTVVIRDHAGNRHETPVEVRLDTGAPVIDTGGRHGVARFVAGADDFEEAPLANQNDDRPLYLLSDRVDLDGVPITRADLAASGVPFFGFSATNPSGGAVTVSMQYERNDQVIASWRDLDAVEGDDGYLVPIASETLAASWHQTVPSDRHAVRVKVTNEAGNSSEALFTFRADIRVPGITVDAVANTGQTFFDGYDFARRADINGVEFDANRYTFTNATGKAFYVTFSDDSTHQADQLVETMVREHTVRPVTGIEWRVRPVNNLEPGVAQTGDYTCPAPGDWEAVSALRNYTGTAWETHTPPAGAPGEPVAAMSDALPDPEPQGDWSDAPDFDGAHEAVTRDRLFYSLRYERDYLLPDERPALVRNWMLQQSGSPNVHCDDLRNFQQRTTITYESVDGPKNTAGEFRELTGFETTAYAVIDTSVTDDSNPQGTPITPFQGWYRVPAGHTVAIIKRVTAPALIIYNDTEVADPDTFSSYDRRELDRTIAWTVRPKLIVTAAHDAGAERLLSMSPRDTVVAADADPAVYRLSR